MSDPSPEIPAAQDQPDAGAFVRAAESTPPSLLAEFWDFLKYNKKWWLTPIILVLLLVGLLVLLSTSVVAPFIYPFF